MSVRWVDEFVSASCDVGIKCTVLQSNDHWLIAGVNTHRADVRAWCQQFGNGPAERHRCAAGELPWKFKPSFCGPWFPRLGSQLYAVLIVQLILMASKIGVLYMSRWFTHLLIITEQRGAVVSFSAVFKLPYILHFQISTSRVAHGCNTWDSFMQASWEFNAR
jgi:hypothetical protein